jgi:hypothetical protein
MGAASLLGLHEGLFSGAIRVASRHLNDHIQQGRRVACEILDGSYNVAAFDQDVKMCLDRMLRLPREIGVVGIGSAGASMCAPACGLDAPDLDAVVEVQSARRTEATVQFLPRPDGFVPSVLPLFSADRAVAPITNARFVVKDGTRLVLVVKVPDQQPLGTYTAAIVDAQTQELGGVITIKVLG